VVIRGGGLSHLSYATHQLVRVFSLNLLYQLLFTSGMRGVSLQIYLNILT